MLSSIRNEYLVVHCVAKVENFSSSTNISGIKSWGKCNKKKDYYNYLRVKKCEKRCFFYISLPKWINGMLLNAEYIVRIGASHRYAYGLFFLIFVSMVPYLL